MPTRRNRRPIALIAATLVAIGLIAPLAHGATAPTALPPQGVYEGCSPGWDGDACIERLVRIRAAGFRDVLNYSAWYGSTADVLRYADAAAALGLELIWPLNHPAWRGLDSLGATYPGLAPDLGGTVELVADHPATWGFYIGDELPASEAWRVRRLSATVRELAPAAQLLYVARPGTARLAPFARFVDLAGADTYPVGSSDPPVRRAARSAYAAASAAGANTAMVLQAFSWSQYKQDALPPRYPNARTLRTMRDAAIRHAHPALILWYSYHDILRSDDPRRRWRDLVSAALPGRRPIRVNGRDVLQAVHGPCATSERCLAAPLRRRSRSAPSSGRGGRPARAG